MCNYVCADGVVLFFKFQAYLTFVLSLCLSIFGSLAVAVTVTSVRKRRGTLGLRARSAMPCRCTRRPTRPTQPTRPTPTGRPTKWGQWALPMPWALPPILRVAGPTWALAGRDPGRKAHAFRCIPEWVPRKSLFKRAPGGLQRSGLRPTRAKFERHRYQKWRARFEPRRPVHYGPPSGGFCCCEFLGYTELSVIAGAGAGEQQAEGLRDVVSGVWPSSFRSSSCAGDGHGEFWEPAESQGRNRNPLSESSELFSFLFFSFL